MKQKYKRIVSFIISLIMVLSIAALSGCDSYDENAALREYRALAVTYLENVFAAKNQDNFTLENWARVQGYVEAGIGAINAAETKLAVREAREKTQTAIRAVRREVDSTMVFNRMCWQFDLVCWTYGALYRIEPFWFMLSNFIIINTVTEWDDLDIINRFREEKPFYFAPMPKLTIDADEQFFIYHSLIVFAFHFPDMGGEVYEISLTREGSELYAEVIRIPGPGYAHSEEGAVVLALSKSDILDITTTTARMSIFLPW